MCWNLWTFTECNHKEAEITVCGRRSLMCRTINRDARITTELCHNCRDHEKAELTDEQWRREVKKAEGLYWYVKGPGGEVGMRGGDFSRC
ncbi:hypothetical protein TWF730_003698 [Orbilia blumenaviensis]|uniref:Uncharacterized protein n=1 Tax=Orbilia blumenaviensis TaxID=1796055 RepID=A0AAV9U705_9PEZI